MIIGVQTQTFNLSVIITEVVQVEIFPLLSVTVSITLLFNPRLIQSKEVWLMDKLAIPHASKDPPSISLAPMVTVPFEPSSKVKLLLILTTIDITQSHCNKIGKGIPCNTIYYNLFKRGITTIRKYNGCIHKTPTEIIYRYLTHGDYFP